MRSRSLRGGLVLAFLAALGASGAAAALPVPAHEAPAAASALPAPDDLLPALPPAALSDSPSLAPARAAASAPSPAPALAGGAALGLLGVLGVTLYHRIRPHAALENGTRKAIFEAVCATPGMGVHAIAERAGVSYSTTAYHLERLVEAGMIVMTPDGNKLCYYKNGGAFTEAERRLLPLLKNEEAVKLLEAILETPGTYRAALAGRLGVTATTINWHLRRLRELGLVAEVRAGRNAYLYPRAGALRESLAALEGKVGPGDAAVAERLSRHAAGMGATAGS